MIRMDAFSCAYPGAEHPVLRTADLHVPPGCCVLLQGGSGGGKSTILRLLSGVIPNLQQARCSGRILLNGANIEARPLHETGRNLATVFQDCRSQFFMTHVSEELVFASENYGRPRRDTAARLARYAGIMGLEQLMDRSVFRLSSGERQRVAIVAAAVQGTPALALDEPSANLDADGLARLARLLTALKAEGRAILVADHRSAYLQGVADERLTIQDGRIAPTQNASAAGQGQNAVAAQHHVGEVLVALTGISMARGGRRLLHETGFCLHAGELLAVCGGNGTGKTSLLRLLCGLEKPTSGTISLHGRRTRPSALRRTCALVMQDPDYQLFSETVAAEIGLGNHDFGQQGNHVLDIAKRLGLDALLARHPGSLSMGQKQRTLIAAALATHREVLLLDEPTSGMEATRMNELAEELRQWASTGRAAVLVTHDEDFLRRTGARRLELRNGQLKPGAPAQEE